MANILTRLFGTKNERDVKAVTPQLKATLAAYERIDRLSDDELREASAALRTRVREFIAPEEAQVASIKEQLENVEIAPRKKEKLADEQDRLVKLID